MDTRHRHVCLHEAPTLLSRAYHNDSVFHSHNIFPTVVLCIKIVALISETDPSSFFTSPLSEASNVSKSPKWCECDIENLASSWSEAGPPYPSSPPLHSPQLQLDLGQTQWLLFFLQKKVCIIKVPIRCYWYLDFQMNCKCRNTIQASLYILCKARHGNCQMPHVSV